MRNRLSFDASASFTERIEKVIPGGAHTYTKGRDQFPALAPNGISRGEGALVWDADGNCLIDWSMGLTSVSLGHANAEVNKSVCDAIQLGVNFQRPAQLELEAAEAFLDVAGTDMVKFAKHGSVVNTATVKLARAYTGRSIVAVPAQHPFFSFDDWFIGTTAADFGIPEDLKRFTKKFDYNDAESLEMIFKEHPGEVACVMLEPVKFTPPVPGFLEEVRAICTRHGAVLVLDEMVTGLKFAVPGAGRFFNIEGDIYTYGKGIANGFSACALTGKGDIMRLGGLEPAGARKLFLLSTTHGAESSGLAAMIKTLELFKDGSIIADNWRKGEALMRRLTTAIAEHGLQDTLRLSGYPCLFALETNNASGAPDMALRTLFMQEMIAAGVLFQGIFMLTPSHTEREIETTVGAFGDACAVYRQALAHGSADGLLTGPPVRPVFRKVL